MQTQGPVCPYCNAAWSDAMLAQYDLYADHSSCSCSAHAGQHVHETEHADAPIQVPTQDLCCEACGKPIYRAPTLVG